MVSVVSTKETLSVPYEIVYDSNSEFGYIIVETAATSLSITLDRESLTNNDIFGADFKGIVTINNPPMVDKPFRMKM